MQEETPTNWHIRKEISVGHIGTTIMVVIAMVAGWYELQNRLGRLEAHLLDPSHNNTAERLDQIDRQMMRVEATDAALSSRLEILHAEILRRMQHQDETLSRIEERIDAQMVPKR